MDSSFSLEQDCKHLESRNMIFFLIFYSARALLFPSYLFPYLNLSLCLVLEVNFSGGLLVGGT